MGPSCDNACFRFLFGAHRPKLRGDDRCIHPCELRGAGRGGRAVARAARLRQVRPPLRSAGAGVRCWSPMIRSRSRTGSPGRPPRWPGCWRCAGLASCGCRMSRRRGSRWRRPCPRSGNSPAPRRGLLSACRRHEPTLVRPAADPDRPVRRLGPGTHRPRARLRARPRRTIRRGLRCMSTRPYRSASCWSPGSPAAGKLSVLRALEDLGYEAVDNPPLPMLEEMVTRERAQSGDRRRRPHPRLRRRPGAGRVGAAARQPGAAARAGLCTGPTQSVLLRRYTETRRRHPLAPQGRVLRRHRAKNAC